MARDLRKEAEKAQMKAQWGGYGGYGLAALGYVNKGLKGLKLTPLEEQKLKRKLLPIVERQMASERGRTATRAKGIANREAKKNMAAAKRKILGGK